MVTVIGRSEMDVLCVGSSPADSLGGDGLSKLLTGMSFAAAAAGTRCGAQMNTKKQIRLKRAKQGALCRSRIYRDARYVN